MGILLLALFGGGQAWAQTVEYIHTDALGSPVAVTDANGNVVERTVYEPYGAQVNRAVVDGPGYTGHVSDAATGLSYMQQRYYDPEIPRFLSVDPVTAYSNPVGAFNRYWYANNNPYRFTDPDGRQSWSNTGTANPWPAVQQACGGSNSCEQEVAEDLARAEIGIAGGMALLAIPDPSDLVIGAAIGRLALGLRASSSFPRAKRYIESIADSLGPTGGRSGRRTAEFSGQGGEAGASKLFSRLTRGESTPRDGGRLGSLGDGSRVQMSTRITKDGIKETSVRISSERLGSRIKDVIKVRFREKPE
ncbi:RHS repeat-associated core domain-containing protein [[Pseudomonas] boreopolis]|uniref:RHS repeat-associated core domain-containing protein n=1 Tax=Xanthomonas boreopolis TaxID=86183 RepID=UPI003DA122E2